MVYCIDRKHQIPLDYIWKLHIILITGRQDLKYLSELEYLYSIEWISSTNQLYERVAFRHFSQLAVFHKTMESVRNWWMHDDIEICIYKEGTKFGIARCLSFHLFWQCQYLSRSASCPGIGRRPQCNYFAGGYLFQYLLCYDVDKLVLLHIFDG